MITSMSNPQVKRVLQLNTKARARRDQGLFPAEGIKLFREAPEKLREQVFVSASFEQEKGDLVEGISHEIVEDRVFAHMCDTQTPQGILTLLRMPTYTREDLLGGEKTSDGTKGETSSRTLSPLLLVLEDLQDPGNVGTILRTAEGAGVTGLILSRNCVDLFHPKTIRSTMGSVFRMPFVFEENLLKVMEWLKEKKIRTFAAHLQGNRIYNREDYRGGTAFVIGNEGKGLSPELAACCDSLIRIPMEGQVESLNAAVATALFIYEAHAQRNP